MLGIQEMINRLVTHQTIVSPVQVTFGMRDGKSPLRFKLFGIGGAGCNLVAESQFPSVAVGGSAHETDKCRNSKKIVMKPEELASFADADISVLAPNMLPASVTECFFDHDITVLAAGLGGATGSIGIRMFAAVSKIMSKPCISIVSMPFSVESITRREVAKNTLADLKKYCDVVICFSNDKLKKLVPNMPIDKAFRIMNAIMERPITDLSKVMVQSDVAMMKQVADGSDVFCLGVGLGKGSNRDLDAVKEAVDSPWFDFNLDKAVSAYLISSSYPVDAKEIDSVVREVHKRIPNARLMFGSCEDSSVGDRLRATLLIGKPSL